ncbi:NfeD family protein [Barnesiella sp. WM24]|nr:NfeD family protein [Barnesiella sp. WM24]
MRLFCIFEKTININLAMSLWIIWLIAAAVLLVIELLTGLVATLCVAVGCLFAFVAALVGFGMETQLAVMAVGVILSFIFLVPFVNRIRKGKKSTRTDYNSNMEALIGREGFLNHEIPADGGLGRLRIDGDDWQVRSHDGLPLAHGTKVRVTGYDSIILTVKPA